MPKESPREYVSQFDAGYRFGQAAGNLITNTMKGLELLIEWIILAARWLLVVFYLGLVVALAVYAWSFVGKLTDFIGHATSMSDADTILKVLSLIDAALVGSLVVMVMISGYESYVSKFDNEEKVHWLGQIDAGALKIKVASTIVLISSIHLLQVFLKLSQYSWEHLLWFTLIHIAFVASAFFMAWVDKLQR